MSQIEDFTRYTKISETFAYFSDGNTLKFTIKLKRKNKEGEEINYHKEYKYKMEDGSIGHSINLSILNSGWEFGKSGDLKKKIFINSGNLVIVRYHLKNILEKWYLNSNIYEVNKFGNLYLKGRWKSVQIPFDEYNYIEFLPIAINYDNGPSVQGCRVTINSKDNFIDMTINEFLNFYSYLFMDTAALVNGLLNYVKSPPYNINISRIGDSFNRQYDTMYNSNFFTNKQDKQ